MRPDRAYIRLQSGRKLDLLDPQPAAWTDADLAVGLSRTYRWGGHSVWDLQLSVAQHSLLVLVLRQQMQPHEPLTPGQALRESGMMSRCEGERPEIGAAVAPDAARVRPQAARAKRRALAPSGAQQPWGWVSKERPTEDQDDEDGDKDEDQDGTARRLRRGDGGGHVLAGAGVAGVGVRPGQHGSGPGAGGPAMMDDQTGKAAPLNNLPAYTGRDAHLADPPPPCLHWVALYLVTLGWGGPQEGGWWYDSGELVTDPDLYVRLGGYPAAFPTEDEAYAYCACLNLQIASLNEGRRPKSSVASEGEYEVLVLEVPMLPQHWPGTPPHYE